MYSKTTHFPLLPPSLTNDNSMQNNALSYATINAAADLTTFVINVISSRFSEKGTVCFD